MHTHRELLSDKVAQTKGPYRQGVEVLAGERLLFTSGLTARDETGAISTRGAGEQTVQILENLANVLREGGGSLADVVQMTVFLTDDADYEAMQEVRATMMRNVVFTSSTIICGLHAPDALVEIQVVAAIKPQ